MSRLLRHLPILTLAAVLSTALPNPPVLSASVAEDGTPLAESYLATVSVDNTNVDSALASALVSPDPVPVIIVLKDQPFYNVVAKAQEAYLPSVRERNAAVRAILAKYAGKRDFISPEEMQEQARKEAEAVTPDDRRQIKALNKAADEILSSMRKETIRQLRSRVAPDQAELAAVISAAGGRLKYAYTVPNAIAVDLPGKEILTISKHPLVLQVLADRRYEAALDVSAPTISAGSFWTPGFNGGIYDAAICDSGVDTAHPALDDDTTQTRTWYEQVFHASGQSDPRYNDNPTSTDDFQGHGTHVAGIVFSSDATYRGIAFGADVGLNLKSGWLNTGGGATAYDSDTRAALHWAHQQTQEPEVVNYSYGGEATTDDSGFCQFFDAFIESYVCTVTISAGNSGSAAGTVETPSISYNCMSVANMNDQNTTNRSDDVIRATSSRGPTVNGRKKPDITAPGTSIMSTNYAWEGAGSDFVNKSGTSMASPTVGAASLLLCSAGVTDPREIKAILINTADDWGDADWDATYGWGYLNLAGAYLHRNDSFLHSVSERPNPGWYRLYKTTGMDAGENATMVWYRHAVYNGSSEPTTVYGLNDLNLRLYDEATNTEIDSDLGGIDNVHQVTSDRSGTQVIRAYDWSFSSTYPNASEMYALATQEGTTLVAGEPTVTPAAANQTPPLYAKFIVTVGIHNSGEIAAHNCTVTLGLPAGVILSEGSLTQSIGTISAGSTEYAYYTLDTTLAGVKTVNISTASDSYGLSYSGSGSFTVTPGAQDTTPPYTVLRIAGSTYQTGGTDKVANGGFESDLSSWTTSGTAAILTSDPHSGSKCLKLGPGTGSAYQAVTIDPGTTYATLSFWYKSDASGYATVGCQIRDSSGSWLLTPENYGYTVSTWHHAAVDVSRFIGQTIQIRFYSTTGTLDSSTFWLDDITLKQNESVYIDDSTAMLLLARDDNSGIDYKEYHINSDPWTDYAGDFNLFGKPDGTTYVYYRSVDNSGNVEPTITARLYLDTAAPKSVLRIDPPRLITGGTEKVLNGGFETGTTDWTHSGAVLPVTTSFHSGVRSLRVGSSDAGYIYQDVPIGAFASRAFASLWVRSIEGTGSTYISIIVTDPATGLTCYGVGFNHTADWTLYTWDVSRFRGASVRIRVQVYLTSGSAATAYVDDVSVTEGSTAYISSSSNLSIYSADLSGEKKYERNVDSAGYVEGQTFTISGGGAHSVLYRATDQLDHLESAVSTQLNVDASGPTGSITINDGAEYTTSYSVMLTLSASDIAGVSEMRIMSDAGVWEAWEPYQTTHGYGLATTSEGVKTLSVQYRDSFGNDGGTYSDSIIYKTPTPMDIPDAKMIPDGEGVELTDKIVTAIFPTVGYFYIEEPDRTSGIRVECPFMPPAVNTYCLVRGVTDTLFAERVILATNLKDAGPAPEIEPLELTNRALGGGTFDYQAGVPGVSGLNNVGLLVRTTGRVVRHAGSRFYIDDGSPIADSRPDPMVLVDHPGLGGWVPPLDSYVAITGASGMSTLSGSPIRMLRPRSVDDVQILQADAVYIYNTDPASAQSFKILLDSQNIHTDTIDISKLLTTDLTPYDVILIANDSGDWVDPALVDAIVAAGKPVIGIGYGGAHFLDGVAGLYIGWGNSVVSAETSGIVVGGGIYTYPHDLVVSPGDIIKIFSSAVTTCSLNDGNMLADDMLRRVTVSTNYPLAREGGYYQWGYYAPASVMTLEGRSLFTNLVFRSMLP